MTDSWDNPFWFIDLLKCGVTNLINEDNKTVEYD